MKKKLLFIALVISSIFHAQLPSSSEKWNSTFQRYDIYASSGTLIGYKKFNHTFGRWETYDLRTNNEQNSNNNSGWDDYVKAKTRNRSVPDLEYPTISSSDIEYARIIAQSNINRQNAERARYAENNLKILQNKVDEYFSTINSWSDVSQDVKDKMTAEFNERIDLGNRRFTDLSQKSTADAAWYYYRDTYNELLEKYVNGPNRKRREELANPYANKTVNEIFYDGRNKQRDKDYNGAIKAFHYLFENNVKLGVSADREYAVLYRLVSNSILIGAYADANFYNLTMYNKFPQEREDFLENNGKIMFHMGKYADAVQSFNEILLPYGNEIRTPHDDGKMAAKMSVANYEERYVYRGKANLKLGKSAISCNDFNVALKFNPSNEEAKNLKNKYCQKK